MALGQQQRGGRRGIFFLKWEKSPLCPGSALRAVNSGQEVRNNQGASWRARCIESPRKQDNENLEVKLDKMD